MVNEDLMRDRLFASSSRKGADISISMLKPLYGNTPKVSLLQTPKQSILHPLNLPAMLHPDTRLSVTPVVLRKLQNIDLFEWIVLPVPLQPVKTYKIIST